MLFLGFGLIAVVEGILIYKRRHLFGLEILAIWMIIAVTNQDIMGVLVMNLKWIELTSQLNMFWATALNRLFVVPLCIVLVVNELVAATGWLKRAVMVTGGILLLMLNDYVLSWLGMTTLVRWNVGLSLVEWLICVGVAWLAHLWFQHLLKKEGHKHEAANKL